PRSDRHPAGPHPRGRISPVHEIEAGAKIVHLAGPVAEGAGTFSRAPKIEAKHGAADLRQRLGCVIHDLRMHRAAVLRVRMTEDDGSPQMFTIGRLFQERFEPPGGSGNLSHPHDAARPSCPRSDSRETKPSTSAANASGRV